MLGLVIVAFSVTVVVCGLALTEFIHPIAGTFAVVLPLLLLVWLNET